ncbi:MAG: protein kinase [Desulfobacterales bacterium]|nr:protein kinase [Desulfobacterales bacterium]
MPPPIPSSIRPQQILGDRFELLALLGRGGMGEVWLTRDLELEVRIALKLLHPRLAAAEGAVAFMKNECRAARRLTHPNIVRVYDFHQQDDLAFISMEWIEGPTFDRWMLSAGTDQLQPVRVLGTVADALDHIHGQGLVHRDVKARNILMTPHGQPKLTDFGIVGLWRFQEDMLNIQTGGSAAGMSPQQREGHPPDPADDIYALGVLLQVTLAGGPNPAVTLDLPGSDETVVPEIETPAPSAAWNTGALLQLAAQMQASSRRARPASMTVVRDTIDTALAAAAESTMPPNADVHPLVDDRTSRTADHVAPQSYTPGKDISAPPSRRPPPYWGLGLVMAAVGLMAAGIWLITVLAPKPPVATTPAASPGPAAVAPPAPSAGPDGGTRLTRAPQETAPGPDLITAEKSMALWLRLNEQLKEAHAADWAAERLEQIETRAQAADAAMMARDYTGAAETYSAAVAEGEALLAEREPRYAAAMQAGAEALQAERPAKARDHFSWALKIKPGDATASQGLAAADILAKVLVQMDAGRSHEREGRYALALADYEAVLAIDGDFIPAREAVDRLREQIAATQYNRLVADGLSAYHQNRLNEARGHIKEALLYRPGGHEAREALRQIDTAARNQRIARLRQRGNNAENREQWDQALKAYENALAIDPALQFARDGAMRSRERIRLDKRLRYYLDNPEVLASDRYLQEARQLLTAIAALEPRGPRLSGDIQTLEARIKAAQTIVPVTLLSDGQTEVAVLRVARLGRITRRTLELRPGIYTVVGARNGYKDVRQTIRVEADQQALQVSIACKEKI